VIDEGGVTRLGIIEVGLADPDRLMRPVVGTVGPTCKSSAFRSLTVPCSCVVHREECVLFEKVMVVCQRLLEDEHPSSSLPPST